MSAKASISGNFSASARASSPCSAAASRTLSRPLSSGWKPAPSSSSAPMRPRVRTLPEVGVSTPVISLSSVDLPAPFSPMIASDSPGCTAKLMSSSTLAWRRAGRPRTTSHSAARRSPRWPSTG